MPDEIWLHIGLPKSGTSSLQKHLLTHRESLAGQGVSYVTPKGKTSCNDLAVAMNKSREDLGKMAADLNAALETCPAPRAFLSSEMFYGMTPEALFSVLPALRGRPLKVLAYLRRQDRYIEAKYLQKAKNLRFLGSIDDFIERFAGSGSDYAAQLAPWLDLSGVTLVPRILERTRLVGGDVVSDVYDLLGLGEPEPEEAADNNVSPGIHRVQLLQAAAAAGLADPRRLQRALAAKFPQDPKDRGPILSQTERRAYLAAHEVGNALLCARYFPDQMQLFDTDDLDRDAPGPGIPAFTEAQLAEITRLLAAVKSLA